MRITAVATVRRELPRALARSCWGISPCIGSFHRFRQPAATERLVEAYDRLDMRKTCLRQGIFGLIKRLLGLQHRHQINGALTQPLFRYVKGAPGARHHIALKSFALSRLANIVECVLYVGESRDYGLAVGLQEFVLLTFLQVKIAEKLAAMEYRLCQAGRRAVDCGLRPQQQFEKC